MGTRTTTLLDEVLKADPTFHRTANFPTEYQFSNGRRFEGYYKKRGTYGVDYLLDEEGEILLDENGDALLGEG